MLRTHELSASDLEGLASGPGAAATIASLRTAQVSKRLLQLRFLLQECDVPNSWDYFALLQQATKHLSTLDGSVLAYPQFGAWLAATLRHSRGVLPGGSQPTDVGYLAGAAAVSALESKMDFALSVPAATGALMLPGLGMACGSGNAAVEISSTDGHMFINSEIISPGRDDIYWRPLRALESISRGLRLRVFLDDVDPYRDGHGLAADGRQSADDVKRWQDLLDQSWDILTTHHRAYAEGIAAGLRSVVPLVSEHGGVGVNVTSMDSFGAVSLTRPVDGLSMALALLHEFQHAKLGALLDVMPMYTSRNQRLFYVPWRDDPRPLGAVLQGVYAFFGVADFWRVQRHLLRDGQARQAEAEFARWHVQVSRTLALLEKSDEFSESGQRFLTCMRARLDSWKDEPVTAEAVELSRVASADHWTGWRLRNLVPDPMSVDQLAQAWRSGLPCPPLLIESTTSRSEGRRLSRSSRLDLLRLKVTEPSRLQTIMDTDDGGRFSHSDVALARGQFTIAASEYVRLIHLDSSQTDSWIGLLQALAGAAGGQPPSAAPELCLTVYRELASQRDEPVDPVRLIQWLSSAAISVQDGLEATSAAVQDRS